MMTKEVSGRTYRVSEAVAEVSHVSDAIVAAISQTAEGTETVRDSATRLRELSGELLRHLAEFRV